MQRGVSAEPGDGEAYAFGSFLLDVRSRALYRNGLPVELPTKIFEVLHCFILSGGRVVSKDALAEHVWHATPVGDNNIAQHVHLTRTVLDDSAKPHKYIATVHGRGYRLLVEPRKIQVAQRIALGTEPQTSRLVAAELISNAAFFTKMGTAAALDSAMHICSEVLDVAGPYAEAHAQIALTAILKAVYLCSAPLEQFEVARRHAVEALRLDARCARAHIAMAAICALADLTLDPAFAHLEEAASIRPDMREVVIFRAVLLTAAGRPEEGRNLLLDALPAHPGSASIASYAAFCAYQAGDLEWTVHTLKRLLLFKPFAAFATFLLGCASTAQGDYAAARETLMSIISGRASAMAGYEKFRHRAVAVLSFVEARSGAIEDARALARDVQRSEPCSYVSLAQARAGAGEEEAVIACIQEARRRHDPSFPFVQSDPLFREYRDRPEFQSACSGDAPTLKIS